jgi:AcrR family transcriptional regulator
MVRSRKKAPGRRRRGEYHHGDLRRALLDEARAVVAKRGVDAVNLSALARRFKVSVAAPFRHFASRQVLLVALAEEGAALLVERMQAAAAQASDPLEAQRAGGVAYVRFAVEEVAYFRLLTRTDVVTVSSMLRLVVECCGAKRTAAPAAVQRARGHHSASGFPLLPNQTECAADLCPPAAVLRG